MLTRRRGPPRRPGEGGKRGGRIPSGISNARRKMTHLSPRRDSDKTATPRGSPTELKGRVERSSGVIIDRNHRDVGDSEPGSARTFQLTGQGSLSPYYLKKEGNNPRGGTWYPRPAEGHLADPPPKKRGKFPPMRRESSPQDQVGIPSKREFPFIEKRMIEKKSAGALEKEKRLPRGSFIIYRKVFGGGKPV